MDCREQILSEEYMDIIAGVYGSPFTEGTRDSGFCMQKVSEEVNIFYINRENAPNLEDGDYTYSSIPVLYTPLSSEILEAAGILQAASEPIPGVMGQGVLLGFIDTGIDYTHPAFLDELGQSRILRVWDQTNQTGKLPKGFDYGSEYRKEQLDEALLSENPLHKVPFIDENGHGTYVCGVSAGSRVIKDGQLQQGAAPLAGIAAVKLKPAKQYLRDYYQIPDSAAVYQENDIMLAIRYLKQVRQELGMPMVLCFTLGTNTGGHGSESLLNRMLDRMNEEEGIAAVAAAGNEGARAHHFYGIAESEEIPEVMELQIAQGEEGFMMEIWPEASELVTIAVVSPSGQRTERFSTRIGVSSQLGFVLEGTKLRVRFWFDAGGTGGQIIRLHFEHPSPGIWQILVYGLLHYAGGFHAWLPSEGLIRPDTVFMAPNINTTLTAPSAGSQTLTVGAYDSYTGSIYIQSGRGDSRIGAQKPLIAAPGVRVEGPSAGNLGYESRNGTSGAAALAAGAAASLFTWGIVQGNFPLMTGTAVRFFLAAGAVRQEHRTYPDREWGYGMLNLYQVFRKLGEFV